MKSQNFDLYLLKSFFEGLEFFLLLGSDLFRGDLKVDVLLFFSLGNLEKSNLGLKKEKIVEYVQ
jgi:hypothetical protein